MKKKNIVIVGLGYVGLPLALLSAKKGFNVIGIDLHEEKVSLINRGLSPFEDEDIKKALKKTTLKASTTFESLDNADIIIICVPTPVHENNMPNYGPVIGAGKTVAQHLHKGQTVILESTVNPGVSEEILLPVLEEGSGLKEGKDFYLAHCPERINPGDVKWNVENINRVVGCNNKKGLKIAGEFYRAIINGSIKEMNSVKEAEAVKVVENSFRDINIAFVNELALSFEKLGIDVKNVIDGAATKPFAFMPHYPSAGVGGHCIPVDPYYLIEYAKANGFHHDFLSLARRINSRMPEHTANLVAKGLNKKGIATRDAKVAVLGLAYKGNIDDHRESPSFEIIKHLEEMGAKVITFDPFLPKLSTSNSLKDALTGADAVVLATNHTTFKKVTPQLLKRYNIQVFIDGKNFMEKEKFVNAGIEYKGIGR